MNQVWLAIIAVSVAASAFFVILLLIELRRSVRTIMDSLKTTEESRKTTLEEIQQTLKSIRDITDNIKTVTGDVRTFSGAVKDVGQNIQQINSALEKIKSSALLEASSLKVGIKTALAVLSSNLLNNLFRKGGKQ